MGHRVAFGVTLGTEKRAKRAVDVADVRIVDRRIDDVGNFVARDAWHSVGGGPQLPSRAARLRDTQRALRHTVRRSPRAARSRSSSTSNTLGHLLKEVASEVPHATRPLPLRWQKKSRVRRELRSSRRKLSASIVLSVEASAARMNPLRLANDVVRCSPSPTPGMRRARLRLHESRPAPSGRTRRGPPKRHTPCHSADRARHSVPRSKRLASGSISDASIGLVSDQKTGRTVFEIRCQRIVAFRHDRIKTVPCPTNHSQERPRRERFLGHRNGRAGERCGFARGNAVDTAHRIACADADVG